MGVGLGGRGVGSNRYLVNKGVREEAVGNNNGVYRREANINNFKGTERM